MEAAGDGLEPGGVAGAGGSAACWSDVQRAPFRPVPPFRRKAGKPKTRTWPSLGARRFPKHRPQISRLLRCRGPRQQLALCLPANDPAAAAADRPLVAFDHSNTENMALHLPARQCLGLERSARPMLAAKPVRWVRANVHGRADHPHRSCRLIGWRALQARRAIAVTCSAADASGNSSDERLKPLSAEGAPLVPPSSHSSMVPSKPEPKLPRSAAEDGGSNNGGSSGGAGWRRH